MQQPLNTQRGPSHLMGGLALACAAAAPLLGLLIIGLTVKASSAAQQSSLVVVLLVGTGLAIVALVLAVRALITDRGRLMAVAAIVLALLTNPFTLLFVL